MTSLESKVVTWIHEEFSAPNLKVSPKDVTRLITSKNGHIYIKLLSLLCENFKSKSKYKSIKEASSLTGEKKKRDFLKAESAKVEKVLTSLISAVHDQEKRLEEERKRADMIRTKETVYKSLSSAMEVVTLFCESFSKAKVPQLDADSLFNDELSTKDLFSNGPTMMIQGRHRRKETNFDSIMDDINKTSRHVKKILRKLSSQRLEVPKISLDEIFLQSLRSHNCLRSDNLLDVAPFKNRRDSKIGANRGDHGIAVLNLVSVYEEQRAAQEIKLMDKLEQAHVRMKKLVERLPTEKAS